LGLAINEFKPLSPPIFVLKRVSLVVAPKALRNDARMLSPKAVEARLSVF
jgi:hypothetical protein